MAHIGLHAVQQDLLCLVLGQTGNFFQLGELLLTVLFGLGPLVRRIGQAAIQFFFLTLKSLGFLVKGGFFLLQPPLLLGQLGPALLDFLFVLSTGFMDLVLGFQQKLLLAVLAAPDGFVDDAGSLLLSRADLPFAHTLAVEDACGKGQRTQRQYAKYDQNDL